MTYDRKTELKAAFITIILLSIGYGIYAWTSTPRASSLVGHTLGIIGFLLMLATETLYALRKRGYFARWGSLSRWLAVHIYMGIVGPYMVLLHSSWKFAGLAGLAMLLTIIVVLSGFVGRYIYTSVHRSLAGVEVQEEQIRAELDALNREIQALLERQPEPVRQHILREIQHLQQWPHATGWKMLLWRWWDDITFPWRLRRVMHHLAPEEREVIQTLRDRLARQRALRWQMVSLGTARGLLSLWHTVHVPLGLALFTVAFLHILFALYYGTLSF
ncbi:MAG: hypothetical protein GXO55_11305 [Chloroflexi bacterium]|nr:hypothetical protein [Chloroflexota bacterium]